MDKQTFEKVVEALRIAREEENLRKKIWKAIRENYEGKKSDHDTVMYIRERMLDYICGEDTE